MRHVLILNFMVLLCIFSTLQATAVDFSGTFSGQLPEGPITLKMEQGASGSISGTMTDTDGSTFKVDAELEGKTAFGSMFNDWIELYFEAELDGQTLTLVAVPYDAYGNLLFDNAQQYSLIKEGVAAKSAPKLGQKSMDRPLGKNSETEDGWSGTFSDGTLTLTLTDSGGQYTGQAKMNGLTFPVQGKVKTADTLEGTYTDQGVPQFFKAVRVGDRVTLTTGMNTYHLTRQGTSIDTAPKSQSSKAATPKSDPAALKNKAASDPYMGFGFDPPTGWKHQKTAEGFVLGHDSRKGLIIIYTHDYDSMEELRTAAREGLAEDETTHLMLRSTLDAFESNGVAGEFGGVVQGQPATAYVIDLLSPFGGGMTIIAAVESASYTKPYREAVEHIARSVVFVEPDIPPAVTQWQQSLNNCRLTYMSSYSSSGYGGSYGGYSDQIEIDLCPGGYFNYNDQSSMSADGGMGTSGYSHSQKSGAGTWDVVSRGGQPVLKLTFHQGEVREYQLSLDAGKTYLNGDRYFRICGNEGTPDQRPTCN